MSLIPPLSFCTAFAQNLWEREREKEKIRATRICLWSLSATQYVLCHLVKGNTFFLMGHTNFPFSAVGERCILKWYYIYDAWKKAHSSPSPPQSAVRNPDSPKAAHHYAFSLCGCLFVFLPMPPWNLPLSHCERVYLPGAERALLWVVAPEWVSTCGPFSTKRACVHTFEPTRWSHLLVYCQYQMAQGL